MRWNAVRNSKKPRAALIKSKKRSEEKEKEKKLMRERGREKRRERTREKWNKETIRLGDSIAAVVSRGEREKKREPKGKCLLTGKRIGRGASKVGKRGLRSTRVVGNEGDTDDVAGPTAFMIRTTANCTRYFTRTEPVQQFMIVLAIFALNRPINTRSTRQ